MEYASRAFRLSLCIATSEPTRIVAPATQAMIRPPPLAASRSGPNTYTATFRIVNTPAFTTATACSSALTGVGATIAAGSQRWKGISAALPTPNANRQNTTAATPSGIRPARMPPSRNSTVPA